MNKDAYCAGFIAELANQGYTPAEFEEKLDKKAILGLAIPAAVGAVALGLGATGALGRGAGRSLHALTEPTEVDLDIAKKEEELETYKRLIQEARLRAAEQASQQIPGRV